MKDVQPQLPWGAAAEAQAGDPAGGGLARFEPLGVWTARRGADTVVGLTNGALEELDEVHAIHAPQAGEEIVAGGVAFVCESDKAAIDVESPVTGRVTAVNEGLCSGVDLNRLKAIPEAERWVLRCGASA